MHIFNIYFTSLIQYCFRVLQLFKQITLEMCEFSIIFVERKFNTPGAKKRNTFGVSFSNAFQKGDVLRDTFKNGGYS